MSEIKIGRRRKRKQDIKNHMISFEKYVDGIKFRINVYISKMTVVMQSRYYTKPIIKKNSDMDYIEKALENPLFNLKKH